jgi:hypothetical protein
VESGDSASVAANTSAAKIREREKLCSWLLPEFVMRTEEVNFILVSLHPTGRLKGSPTNLQRV